MTLTCNFYTLALLLWFNRSGSQLTWCCQNVYENIKNFHIRNVTDVMRLTLGINTQVLHLI